MALASSTFASPTKEGMNNPKLHKRGSLGAGVGATGASFVAKRFGASENMRKLAAGVGAAWKA
ncbi:hypothetical protein IWQ62_004858 [Dispira parvispora]|uniref:Uncharacterized protein n=1 Tax=Dispira parvispora TaxID=1520584 RepID=A0A9W8E5S3_9FUNG|nr:hypothetical protein IWQ62_004858 [Dispira parvispora]